MSLFVRKPGGGGAAGARLDAMRASWPGGRARGRPSASPARIIACCLVGRKANLPHAQHSGARVALCANDFVSHIACLHIACPSLAQLYHASALRMKNLATKARRLSAFEISGTMNEKNRSRLLNSAVSRPPKDRVSRYKQTVTTTDVSFPDKKLDHARLSEKLWYIRDRMLEKQWTKYLLLVFLFMIVIVLMACLHMINRLEEDRPEDEELDSFSEHIWMAWVYMADPGTHSGATTDLDKGISVVISVMGIFFFSIGKVQAINGPCFNADFSDSVNCVDIRIYPFIWFLQFS